MPKVDKSYLADRSKIVTALKAKLEKQLSAESGNELEVYGQIDEHIKTGAYFK